MNEPSEPTDVSADELTPEEQARPRRTRRLWIGAAAAAVLAAALAVGVLVSLLFGPGTTKVASDVLACVSTRDFTQGAKHNCPPKGAARVDGLIETASTTQIDVVTTDGRRFTYVVRPADAPYLDIPHAQQHAALGQPTTIFTRRYKGATVVVYMKDSDLNFQQEAQ
ncbi:MAG: hypothetical protein H7287_07530 [Thermoleophilia bacterium]|nr:hypothetical protein [Thermoleophilia bacterium]